MKKSFYLIFAVLFLLIGFSGTASAEEQYTEDYFILKSEKFPASENAGSDLLANGFDLEIDGSRVSTQLIGDFNLGGLSNCSGTSSFKLIGDRDVKTGTMKGTFLYLMSGECPGDAETPASPMSLTWQGTFDGFATFDLDPSDETKRIIEGKITNFQGESTFSLNGVKTAPTKTESITINFPETILEGYERGITRLDSGMRFSGMTGQVEWRADNDPDGWKLCKLGDKLPVYAHIRTSEDSSAILSFQDHSTFVLKTDSEVVINTPPEKESKIKMVAGNIWVNFKKMVNGDGMEIEMNQAVAGIKGTTFVLSDDGTTSTLQVIEGEVSFTSKSDGKKVDVVAGSMISATNAGLSSVETFDVAKETADWQAVSSGVKETVDESGNETKGEESKILWFLYGLVGVVVIIALIIGVRKIKHLKH